MFRFECSTPLTLTILVQHPLVLSLGAVLSEEGRMTMIGPQDAFLLQPTPETTSSCVEGTPDLRVGVRVMGIKPWRKGRGEVRDTKLGVEGRKAKKDS